jgi:flavin-dependent dehydrogenase
MYYRYVDGMPTPNGGAPDGPEFSVGDDELAYVFPSDGGLACVALSINVRDYTSMRPRASDEFGSRVARHPFLAPRLDTGSWTGRLFGCGPRPGVMRVPIGPGWALVGDASLVQDPWTGLGMDNAAIHATFLAEALDAVLSGRRTERDAFADYHRRRDDHALPGFRMTCSLGRDLNALRAETTQP